MYNTKQDLLTEENKRLREEIEQLRKENELLKFPQSSDCLPQFLIDQMDAIIFIKDAGNDFRYFMVNENFCKVQHLSRTEIIGKNDYEIFPPDDARKYREDDEKAVYGKTSYSFQEEVNLPGQNKIILKTTKSYVSASNGNKFFVCISHDVTQSVEKETRLKNAIEIEQAAHQMMKAIFHKLPSAILIKDIEDNYRFYIVNKKFEQMCNMSKEILIGKTDYDVFPKSEADKYRKDDIEASLYTESDPMVIQEIVTSPDRDVNTHLQTFKFSFSFKGKSLLICVGVDITLQHQMMEQIKEALEKAEQADRLKSQFITNMSHEIRTPLNAIIGFSQLIAETEDKEEQKEYHRIVTQNNNLLLTLIEDVLNLSELNSGNVKFNNTEFDFADAFRDLYTQMKEKVFRPEVTFTTTPSLPSILVRTDRERIIQIIGNLVTNAAKFTSKGTIQMGYACKDNGLEIYVKDTGLGIKAKNLESIFNRFKKLNPFIQGTGLGLPICKSIAEQMGGRIWVESEFGKGSTFYVWIPCVVSSIKDE